MDERSVLLASFLTFGDLLKYLRKRAQLSQRELAIAVGYSESQISRMETNLRTPDCASLLAIFVPALAIQDEPEVITRLTELARRNRAHATEPDHFEGKDKTGAPGQAATFGNAQLHNLPGQLTTFIGRKKEIALLRQYITNTPVRLITITGAGGIGKTRLALEACSQIVDTFPDGVWLVELAPLRDPSLVAKTTARILGLNEVAGVPILETLSVYMQNRRLLLILDNCEHLLSECAKLVDALLRDCPKLRILATSREILRVPGEVPFRVPSLALADPKALPPLRVLWQVEGVRLFVERAAQVAPEFRLEKSNAQQVALICQRLDGIPLAIELAAARVRVMGVKQIAGRLNDVFHLLTGGARTVMPRQQTLKATIDWSYALLSDQEQLALQRLSVFAGGWSLEGAEAVCAGEGIPQCEVLDLLTGLADKSLVIVRMSKDIGTRYHMLETIRQYAHEKLVSEKLLEVGREEAVRNRHLTFYLQMGKAAYIHLFGQGQQAEWLNRLEEEIDNIRSVLDWTLSTSVSNHLNDRIADGMHLIFLTERFWHIRHGPEGSDWLKRLLNAEAETRGGQPLEVGVQSDYYLLGWCRAVTACSGLENLHRRSFSLEEMHAKIETGERLCRLMGQKAFEELGLILFAKTFWLKDSIKVLDIFEEILAIAHRLQHPLTPFVISQYLDVQYMIAINQGEIEKASAYLKESLAISQKSGNLDSSASCLRKLGELCYYQGEYASGKAYFEEMLHKFYEIGNHNNVNLAYVDRLFYRFVEDEKDNDTYHRAKEALVFFKETGEIFHLYDALRKFLIVEWQRGNFEQMEELAKERSDIYDSYRLDYGKHETELWLGRMALTQKDYPKARQHLLLSAQWICAEASPGIISWIQVVDALATLLATESEPALAAKLFGTMEEKYQHFHLGFPVRQRIEHDQALASVRQALGEDRFTTTWEEGRVMTIDQAIRYTLEVRKS